MVEPGDECMGCICTKCLDQWEACQADPGCAAIQECAQMHHCWEVTCTIPHCNTLIWQNGGLQGHSFTWLWHPLSVCLMPNCAEKCPW